MLDKDSSKNNVHKNRNVKNERGCILETMMTIIIPLTI